MKLTSQSEKEKLKEFRRRLRNGTLLDRYAVSPRVGAYDAEYEAWLEGSTIRPMPRQAKDNR